MNMEKNILEIPIEDILPNRFQPRLSFNEEGINELADSIKQHGIIQPLVVRKLGDKYEIIAGERRYKAATMAGLAKVPAVISDIDDNKSAEVALVENIQRRNLTAIEEAKSYKNLLDRGYLTQEQLASKMGVSQSAIANKLRLLNLDEEVQDALLNEKISERHARALLSLDKEEQKVWLKRIIDERLTVRQLDMELKKAQESDGGDDIKLVNINPNIDEIVSNAEDIIVERPLHDVASMLIPEGGQPVEEKKEETPEPVKNPNKFFNFLEDEQANMNVMDPVDIDAFTSTPNLEMVNEPKELESSETSPNSANLDSNLNSENNIPSIDSIFNESPILENPVETLEDIDGEQNSITNELETPILENEANMEDLENAVNEIVSDSNNEPVETPILENTTSTETSNPENNNIENMPLNEVNNSIEEDSKPITPIEPEPILESSEANQIVEEIPTELNQNLENESIKSAEEEQKPFKSIFFTNDDDDTSDNTIVEKEPIVNNTIEEVEPVVEEPLVDPLDSIVTLEPDYEQKQEELAGRDLKTAINIVRDTVDNLENRGFNVECEEADLEDIYHITIKINKDNKEDAK